MLNPRNVFIFVHDFGMESGLEFHFVIFLFEKYACREKQEESSFFSDRFQSFPTFFTMFE
jgi:hypothetical protein